jgi:hypothetical protein
MSNTVSIAGLDKAAVLKALHDASQPLGLGILHYKVEGLTVEECGTL